MARTSISPVTAPGGYATATVAVTFTAADVANKNQFVSTGRELLVAFNSGATPHNITITSRATGATFNRSGDVTETIAAGEYKIFGPIPTLGWQQIDGFVYFEADHAEVGFAVIRIP